MKNWIPYLAALFVIVALLVSFYLDLQNLADSGSVDMRNRITGIRLLEKGIDPYHYHWHEGEPPEYIDLRNNPHLDVSKTTVTPTLLLLELPFAGVPYRTTQYIWLIVQWFLLLGIGFLWWRAAPTQLSRWFVILFVTGFSFTDSWRWEAERCQAYLLIAFIFTCWLTATLSPRQSNGFIAGLIAGFLITLRPPCLLLIPFMAIHRRGQLAGTALGTLLSATLPMLFKIDIWTNYFSAMKSFSHLYRYGINPDKGPQHFPPTLSLIHI